MRFCRRVLFNVNLRNTALLLDFKCFFICFRLIPFGKTKTLQVLSCKVFGIVKKIAVEKTHPYDLGNEISCVGRSVATGNTRNFARR